MSLFAKYTHEWVGRQWEREVVEKADLHIGHYYPVEQVIMTQSYTDITLARLGHFNSVFFDFYDEDGELDTHQSNGKVVIYKKGQMSYEFSTFI